MTDFVNWWLSLPEDLRLMYGSQAIGPAEEAFHAGQKVEREACAKLCEDIDTEYQGEDVLATWCATAIRARR